MKPASPQVIGEMLALIAHDLRNPAAALSVNLPFILEVVESSPGGAVPEDDLADLLDALGDSNLALDGLVLGLEHFSCVARWIAGKEVIRASDGDLSAVLRSLSSRKTSRNLEVDVPDTPFPVKGGNAVPKILDTLIANAVRHTPAGGTVRITAGREGDTVVLEVQDQGRAIAPDLREKAFTAEGQNLLKDRADGRYERVAGLFSAGILAGAVGATLKADGEDGSAVFRLRLQTAREDSP